MQSEMDEEPLEIRTELIKRGAMSTDAQIKTKKEGKQQKRKDGWR